MGQKVKKQSFLKSKIQNMPLKNAMVLFVVAALLLAAAASAATIMATYSLRMKQFDLGNYGLIDTINAVLFILIFLYIVSFIVVAVYLFYNIKLRQPIKQLLGGTEQIADNDLNFTMEYSSKDELGKLCASFEKMKTELRQSNTKMWRAAEERKKLNAVFAHDLRTPLTVLRGYTDFLAEYIPSEQMQPGKLLQTTCMMSLHIERIEHYVNMMADIQRVEDTPLIPEPISGKVVGNLLEGIVNSLEKQAGIPISFRASIQQITLNLDMDIVQRVLENLLANAVHYAGSKVDVTAYHQNEHLILSVSDDGSGFSQEYLDRPFTPYYQENKAGHFGLGLNVCKTLCQNHNGGIKIANNPDGGAKVFAAFKTR